MCKPNEHEVDLGRTAAGIIEHAIEDSRESCPTCTGSGEGAIDGTNCYDCKGRGEVLDMPHGLFVDDYL